jgi:hypothetical protein
MLDVGAMRAKSSRTGPPALDGSPAQASLYGSPRLMITPLTSATLSRRFTSTHAWRLGILNTVC